MLSQSMLTWCLSGQSPGPGDLKEAFSFHLALFGMGFGSASVSGFKLSAIFRLHRLDFRGHRLPVLISRHNEGHESDGSDNRHADGQPTNMTGLASIPPAGRQEIVLG